MRSWSLFAIATLSAACAPGTPRYPGGTDGAVVTYRAEGPVRILATSVWARRGREWVTVFYQATPAAPR